MTRVPTVVQECRQCKVPSSWFTAAFRCVALGTFSKRAPTTDPPSGCAESCCSASLARGLGDYGKRKSAKNSGFRRAVALAKSREVRLDFIRKKKQTEQPSINPLQYVSFHRFAAKERTRLGFLRCGDGIISLRTITDAAHHLHKVPTEGAEKKENSRYMNLSPRQRRVEVVVVGC